MMDKYEQLSNKYSEFYYNGFTIEDKESYVFITYDFEIKGLIKFNPTLKIPKMNNVKYDEILLKKMVFSAGLAEIPSYWKATCSKNIIIKCGSLDNWQTNWVKKLIYNGLAEFFYVNDISVSFDNFVSIESSGDTYHATDTNSYNGYLVAVGGGKDSITSLEILKNNKNKKAFIINNRKICFDSCYVAGIYDDDIINVERLFDKKIIDLNNEGFLNGHTPLSSCIAFISYLTAYLNNIKYVVLSNEASANESSVKGTNINHQYSKSFEFENDFREYTKKYLSEKIEYFSLLRPLNELQIMKIFTKYPKYFNSFISCNNGGKRKNIGKTDGWCLSCSKCLFIYIIMSNFVSRKDMIDIFGEDLLNKESMLEYFLELLGKRKNKPFECVGTIDEVVFSVNNLIDKYDELPYLLEYYKENYGHEKPNYEVLKRFNDENNVPKDLIDLVRKEISND